MKVNLYIILIFLIVTIINADKIKKLEFKNVYKISPNKLYELIDTTTNTNINYKRINQDIKKLYKLQVFDDISVYSKNSTLQFIFKEKKTISKIEISGYKEKKDDLKLLYSKIEISKGSLFDKERIVNSKNILLEELKKDGYINSVIEVDTKNVLGDNIEINFIVNKGSKIKLSKVNYYGIHKINEDDLSDIIANNNKDFFSWLFKNSSKELKINELLYDQARIRNLYLQKGYIDINVEVPFVTVDFNLDKAVLNFNIKEGSKYKINDIKIILDKPLINKKDLYDKLEININQTFNIDSINKDINFLKNSFINLGYSFARINHNVKKVDGNRVNIKYVIKTNQKVYINNVIISGNSRTTDYVIRRNIYLATGDLFNKKDIKDSKNKLQRTGFFESVDIKTVQENDNTIDLYINVKETTTGSLTLGGGYNKYDGFSINAGINDKNIFGSGKTLGIELDFAKNRDLYDLYLKNPSIYNSKYSGSINLYNKKEGISYKSPDYTLIKEDLGLSLGMGNEIFRNTFTGINYKLESSKQTLIDDDNNDTNYYPSETKRNEKYIISAISPYIKYDSTDAYFFPKNGIKASSSIEIAGLGGDLKYINSYSNYKYFYTLKDIIDYDITFINKSSIYFLIDTGYITQGKTLSLGGVNSLRGYESKAFSPSGDSNSSAFTKMLSTSLELSIPLTEKKIRLNLFYDYGMIGINKINEIKRSTYGAALQIVSPVGPLQFIWARPINKRDSDDTSKFEFTIGQSF